jgi:hypothetical protein
MIVGVEQDALIAARVVDDATADLGAVRAAYDEGAHRVGAEINA